MTRFQIRGPNGRLHEFVGAVPRVGATIRLGSASGHVIDVRWRLFPGAPAVVEVGASWTRWTVPGPEPDLDIATHAIFVPGRDDHGEEDGSGAGVPIFAGCADGVGIDARSPGAFPAGANMDRRVLEATANAAGIPGAADLSSLQIGLALAARLNGAWHPGADAVELLTASSSFRDLAPTEADVRVAAERAGVLP